jgi:hypothetical protein
MALIVPIVGAKIDPTSKFCSSCGRPTPLASAEEEKARGAAGGEEKTMTTKKENKEKGKKNKRMSKRK